MNQRKTTQNSKVLRFLEEHGSITQMDAYRFGCTRLAARIMDLRRAGHRIASEIVSQRDEDGTVVRFARYRRA